MMNDRGQRAAHQLGGSLLRSPADRFLAHQRRRFVRDWILALVALALVLAASLLRPGNALGPSPDNAPSKSVSASSAPGSPDNAP